ncbi:MAG: SHOCT domain-containing protein [Actinomycetia bacterium]|nr:SHOCT domain-containing protein [Actinomycetes bacterium]
MYDDNGWMWGHGWGWGGGIMMILFVVVLVVVVTATVLGIRYLSAPQRAPGQGPPAGATQDRSESLLAERFARGEIDEDEYHRRITVLRDHR